MCNVSLQMARSQYEALRQHLLPGGRPEEPAEEAAFGFARAVTTQSETRMSIIEWHPVAGRGFAHQSGFHLELADETRAYVIKRAHDLQCSLVEFHSHPGAWPAQFSASDFLGLEEFVPHVWWRLRGRPYVAIVVAPSGFDGLAWTEAPHKAVPLTAIDVGGQLLRPTGLSWRSLEETHK